LPLFGERIFQRCSRDEFERRVGQSRPFQQEGMGFAAIMGPIQRLDSYEMVKMGKVSVPISYRLCWLPEPHSSRLSCGENRFVTNREE
jgi:hypothetical protein